MAGTKTFNTHIDLMKSEILNAKLQNLATPPTVTSTDVGLIYFNTVDKKAYCWSGTEWLDLSDVYSHPTFAGTSQPAADLTGASVISKITLTNGHVTGVTTRTLTAANIGAATAVHAHAFSEISSLPANTILGNNTGAIANAKALTVNDLLTMLAIGYGSLTLLNTGTDTNQKTWTPKDLSDFVNSKIAAYVVTVDLALGTRTSTTLPITNTKGTGFTLPSATTTLAGLLSAADKLKLDNIATGANNYVHPTLGPGVHPFVTELTTGLQVLSQLVVNTEGHVVTVKGRNLTAADIAAVMINDTINNGTTTTWSSTKIHNEVQSAITQAQTGALQYKGAYNPVTNSPDITTIPLGVKAGWTYVVSVAGTFAGEAVEAGDMIIAKTDDPLTVLANWQIVNKNIPAIVAATTVVAGIVRLATNAETATGTSSVIAVTPAGLKSVLDARLNGYVANFGDGSTTNFTITHGLATTDVMVFIQEVSTKSFIECDVKAASSTTVTVGVNVAPANNAYRIIIKPI